jgi:hypothetical protein
MENLGIFYDYLVCFTAIGNISWPFSIFCGHWVYFYPFWYFVPRKIWQPCIKPEFCGLSFARAYLVGRRPDSLSENDLAEVLGRRRFRPFGRLAEVEAGKKAAGVNVSILVNNFFSKFSKFQLRILLLTDEKMSIKQNKNCYSIPEALSFIFIYVS